mmetsp:Transcript_15203/g.47055  ORF Transcript_15203/g.47055 Transcript_15203/m.47055 type:complete len:226 (+) Transcript_15203:1295-1972(+)
MRHRAQGGRELFGLMRGGLLRRMPVPSRLEALRRAGRRPDGHGHGRRERVGRQVRGRVRLAADAREPRHPGVRERRQGHEPVAVLRHVQIRVAPRQQAHGLWEGGGRTRRAGPHRERPGRRERRPPAKRRRREDPRDRRVCGSDGRGRRAIRSDAQGEDRRARRAQGRARRAGQARGRAALRRFRGQVPQARRGARRLVRPPGDLVEKGARAREEGVRGLLGVLS